MSQRYQGGILGVGFNPLQAPNAPTIGTATTTTATTASVAFTAPANVGGSAITSYVVQSTPGGISVVGASSPITVTGLTTGTAYTFRVTALNSYGPSPISAASNSVTPSVAPGQQAYTTAGTYSWVAPAGVTSVCVVCVGPGSPLNNRAGGAGGGLGWKNNISVTPGTSYTVVVGTYGTGLDSYFISAGTVKGGAGAPSGNPQAGGTYTGDGGGNGGSGGARDTLGDAPYETGGGGGAGGYSGNGGVGANASTSGSFSGSAGSGGGGGGGASGYDPRPFSGYSCSGGGGGVGLLGQGSSGAGGTGQGAISGGTCDVNGIQGGGGSSGTAGDYRFNVPPNNGAGQYGGGGGNYIGGSGGAVRILWGAGRAFPSTNTGNL